MKRKIFVLGLSFLLAGALVLTAADQEPVEEPEIAPGVKHVPRNRTLICVGIDGLGGHFANPKSYNPYIPGYQRWGEQFVFEPLYFYSWTADEEIPWLAESYRYNEDFTELTIKIRRGVKWSDGVAFTARDVAYTLNMLRDNAPILTYSTDIKKWVKEAKVVDDLTVRVILNAPNARFMFNYLTDHADIGIWIVPEHIWRGKDPTVFTHYDPAKGWPVVTAPYRLVYAEPVQVIWDLREDWWAAKTGFQRLPKVERIIFLPTFEEAKHGMMIVANAVDVTLTMSTGTIQSVLDMNPKVSTFSGRKPPLGYMDWWPSSLYINTLEPPYDDPEIRWAISYAINRDDVVKYGLEGMGKATKVTFPEFPGLMPYIDYISDLLEKYNTGEFNPQKSAEIMRRKGYTKDAEGFWIDTAGKRFDMVLVCHEVLLKLGPPVVESLRTAGFHATFHHPVDSWHRISTGLAKTSIFGNAGSVRDPFMTLNLYHGRNVRPTGEPIYPCHRWSDPEFDRLVDEMAAIPHGDPAMFVVFRQAMEIWLRELPDIPLACFYHRNPVNHTYWTGWPTEDDPYTNDAFWHKTFFLTILRLKPTQ
jgi:peptide/nickel transport system substrate-binding protein